MWALLTRCAIFIMLFLCTTVVHGLCFTFVNQYHLLNTTFTEMHL
jgi:hypothetical protein